MRFQARGETGNRLQLCNAQGSAAGTEGRSGVRKGLRRRKRERRGKKSGWRAARIGKENGGCDDKMNGYEARAGDKDEGCALG